MTDPDEEHEPERVGPKIAAGLAAAGAGTRLGPGGALALGAASPLFESLAERMWGEIRPDARRRMAQMMRTAAETAGCDDEQLGDLIRTSETNRLQAGIAMDAAARTDWPPHVRALGRVLAAGLIAEGDAVDVPQFALGAMVELGRLHVTLLDLLVQYRPGLVSESGAETGPRPHRDPPPNRGLWAAGWHIWMAPQILAAQPQLRPVLTSVVGTLVRHGLADQVDRAREALEQLGRDFVEQINQQAALGRRGGGTGMFTEVRAPEIRGIERSWSPTELGEQVLGFYLEAGAEAEITDPATPDVNR